MQERLLFLPDEREPYPDGILGVLEAVRKRPGMYFGGSEQAATQAVATMLDAYAPLGGHLSLTLHDNNTFSLRDDLDDTFDLDEIRDHTRTSRFIRGLGVSIVAAACEWFVVCVGDTCFVHETPDSSRRSEGIPEHDIRFRWRFDPEVFGENVRADVHMLSGYARDLATAFPGTTIEIYDEGSGLTRTACYPNGAADRTKELSLARVSRTPVHRLAGSVALSTSEHISYDVGLLRTYGGHEILSLVNGSKTSLHGSHVDALIAALAEHSGSLSSFSGCTVVSIHHSEPRFRGSTKDEFRDPELYRLLRAELVPRLTSILAGP